MTGTLTSEDMMKRVAGAPDQVASDAEDVVYSPEQALADESDVSSDIAESFIGGASVHSTPKKTESSASEEKQHKLERNEVTQKDLETHHYKNQHKIFTFTLPFGGNPLAHFPSIRQLKQSLPIIGSADSDDELDLKLNREEIKAKVRRQESITTLEEAYLFKDLKGADNTRFRAMKRALTPAISIPSLSEEKRKVETVWDSIDGEVVILGGYRGSVLKEKTTNSRVWIPSLRAGLYSKRVSLLIGPKDEDELKTQEEIYPRKMLTHVGPVDISRKLKAKLSNGKTKVHTFGYDWRLSADINSQKIFEFLSNLKCNKGPNKKGAIVIAHSMGGLIAHHAMQRDPSLFRGLIYVGVPAMCPNILGPIRYGDTVLFSNKILTPEINFFFRSSFVFLPDDGRCFVDKKTGERYNLDYFDPETWVEYNLSPCVSKERRDQKKQRRKSVTLDPLKSPILKSFDFEMKRSLSMRSSPKPADEFHTTFDEAYDYLGRTLKRTRKFLDELAYDPEKKYPPLAIVYGNEVPTVRGCHVEGPEGIKRGDYDDFYYGPGDGVVHHKWLMPERRGFPVVAKLASEEGHISLMTDMTAMGDALWAVLHHEEKEANVTI